MIKKIFNILIVIFIVCLLFLPLFIRVKIECKSQIGNCPKEVNDKLRMTNNKYLFQANGDISKNLKKDFLVSNFSTQFKLPNIVFVTIVVKKPIFALKNSISGEYELVDQKGTVLATADNSSLPAVVTPKPIEKTGESVTTKDLFALNLISGIYQMYQVGYGTITNDALVVDMPTGVRVLFPLEGDYKVLLGGLRLIYTKVTTNYLGIYSQIDMRYKNPVLR